MASHAKINELNAKYKVKYKVMYNIINILSSPKSKGYIIYSLKVKDTIQWHLNKPNKCKLLSSIKVMHISMLSLWNNLWHLPQNNNKLNKH